MDLLIHIFLSFITGIGVFVGKFLFTYSTHKFSEDINSANKLHQFINHLLHEIYFLYKPTRISIFKFCNGDHFLSNEPIYKIVREYSYPIDTFEHPLNVFYMSDISDIVNHLFYNHYVVINKSSENFNTYYDLLKGYNLEYTLFYRLEYEDKFFGFIVLSYNKDNDLFDHSIDSELISKIQSISYTLHTLSNVSLFNKFKNIMDGL